MRRNPLVDCDLVLVTQPCVRFWAHACNKARRWSKLNGHRPHRTTSERLRWESAVALAVRPLGSELEGFSSNFKDYTKCNAGVDAETLWELTTVSYHRSEWGKWLNHFLHDRFCFFILFQIILSKTFLLVILTKHFIIDYVTVEYFLIVLWGHKLQELEISRAKVCWWSVCKTDTIFCFFELV